MIYKIISDFSQISQILNDITKYRFIYYNDTLYIACVDLFDMENFKRTILSSFTSNSFIQIIDQNNVAREPIKMQKWCYEQLAIIEMHQYEQEQQEELKKIIDTIDKIEEEIFGKEENANGRTNKKTRTTSQGS